MELKYFTSNLGVRGSNPFERAKNIRCSVRIARHSHGEMPPWETHPEFDFKYNGLGIGTLAFNNLSGIGRPGTGVLRVDGKDVRRCVRRQSDTRI